MESTPSGAQPSSKMSGFSVPKPSPAQAQAYVDSLAVHQVAAAPVLTPEDARELATEGVTGDETEALAAMKAKQARQKAEGVGGGEDSVLTYEARIEYFGMKIEDALKIIDALTMEGDYEEEVRISKAATVLLSTRSTRFNSFLADKIDIADPKKVGKLNQLMAEYQIAASLSRYNKTVMPILETAKTPQEWEANLQARLEFVRHLPSPVFLLLSNKLAKFDAKLLVVFSEGYEENF